MRIVFINPSLRPYAKRRHLPVGLAYVMAAVKKSGFKFDLIDMDVNDLSMDDLTGILSRDIYDVYAFGCIVTGFRFARQISEIIKNTNPRATIIAGNSVASSIPELLLKNIKVDIAVLGESDITIVELLEALKSGASLSGVRGIAFKQDGKVVFTPSRPMVSDIDILGFPDWRMFDLEKYNKYGHINANCFSTDKALLYPLNAARGCPFNCSFCYHVFKGQKYRKYSEERVMDEIKRLAGEYGCNYISFWDELTFSTIKSVRDMVMQIRGLDFKIGWEATSRGNLFRKGHLDLIKEMKDSGCENISFSLENADPRILAFMNKKMSVEQFIEQTKVLWSGGVVPLTSVIFGYPQETPESIKKTIKVCEECNIFPSVGFLLPLPGTHIYEWAKEHNFITNEIEYLERIGDRQDFHINLTSMPDDEFVNIVESELQTLAHKQGLKLDSVFKTTTYQKPKNVS